MLLMLENQLAATGSKDKNNRSIIVEEIPWDFLMSRYPGTSGFIAMFVVTYCVDL